MTTQAPVAIPRPHDLRPARLGRLIPPLALLVFGALFLRSVADLGPAEVLEAITGITPGQWALALICTALSFCAVGQYDLSVHRALGTGQDTGRARAAGVRAIALSQALGFGVVTGALVRWRCLPDLSVASALRLSCAVSLSFLAALAVLTALVLLWVDLPALDDALTPMTGLALGGLALGVSVLIAKGAKRFGLAAVAVTPRRVGALMIACALDTGFAAGALWVLWPGAVGFDALFAAYLLALGAGLVSNSPGGMGAFDLTLLALLPASDGPAALAALLAFRIVYYAAPATLSLVTLLHPSPRAKPAAATVPDHPEAALRHQDARVIPHPAAPLLTLPCWGAGAVLGDLPAGLELSDLGRARPVALYKCGPEQAAQARRAGWAVLRIAQEATLTPATWSAERPACRQLRRALRQFAHSGLHIAECTDPETLRPVAADWAAAHGGERGLSMGRYCPDYLRRQRVFAAYDGQTPCAFVSFHCGRVWTLDLMRHRSDLPHGTMQALVCAAIAAARADGACRLSLAAVPDVDPAAPFAQRVTASGQGLRRFKAAFGPVWQPRYLCAPGKVRLALTAATLAHRIRARARQAPVFRQDRDVHRFVEDYSFAPEPTPCEAHSTETGALRHDKRPYRTAENARLVARRWGDRHDPVQHGAAVRRRA
ncbi:phosphatidylglycerol lysyltransferase domain-containing protein [Thalassorhabdomicrobium marinisediminis]|uniref:Phosphatidylglycerol lysyltransferase C-terminal domain-containing protein n=1 Tax=Thalassorhabdomicrobium marinisediminis TaxID=2170577 RepID=A0A2T7FVE5_9RHOB|nr:phosphatidylglycerol lysyltransferase domain-containing protein [Thalassorhabdomicrobium marinisediminis]PVA06146.1 hypothetical protein DC363_12630 [Thalassorhabdomicrobium marinisediminis]